LDFSLLMIWVELGNVEVGICGCVNVRSGPVWIHLGKVRLYVDMFIKEGLAILALFAIFWLCLGFFGKGRVQKGLG